jgi:antitoxin (DNA-binding transcriptional repressor) of toxin-antitoxin stability system
MAVVKIRDLVRQPKRVFAELEATGEPVLVTRNGEAIAALFPVDPQEAAQLAMAALPEFVESRRRAEHARSEGRTRSEEDVARDLALRRQAAGAHSLTEPAAKAGPEVMESIAEPAEAVVGAINEVFGSNLGRELAPQVGVAIAAASQPVILAAAAGFPAPEAEEHTEEAHRKVELRIHQLNGQLFERLFLVILEGNVRDRLATRPILNALVMHEPKRESEGILGKQLAEETLEDVAVCVSSVNRQLLTDQPAGEFSLPVYEAFVKGTEAMEDADRIAAHAAALPLHHRLSR